MAPLIHSHTALYPIGCNLPGMSSPGPLAEDSGEDSYVSSEGEYEDIDEEAIGTMARVQKGLDDADEDSIVVQPIEALVTGTLFPKATVKRIIGADKVRVLQLAPTQPQLANIQIAGTSNGI